VWQCVKCREQVETSFAVCWNCGTSREGVEDPDFRKADAAGPEPEAITELALSQEAPAPKRRAACPECGGSRLEHGYMDRDVRFYRDGKWLQIGWMFRAFVCLDCGRLTQYLSDEDLQTLRSERAALPGQGP
jgi:transposase